MSDLNKAEKGKWISPPVSSSSSSAPGLRIKNTLTKNKDIFIPAGGEGTTHIKWYICGPTVYDKSHIGHARNYMTFDIIRRILEDYFTYNVLFVMNITDIDDKIILNARQQFLWKEFQDTVMQEGSTYKREDVLEKATKAWSFYVEKRFKPYGLLYKDDGELNWREFVEREPKPDRLTHPKFEMYFKAALESLKAIELLRVSKEVSSLAPFLTSTKEIFSLWLDSTQGHRVTDPKIYKDFSTFWEKDFFADMKSLGVKGPDVLTRISEYVPEVVTYIQRIIENGFAYESQGSVYFDTVKFDGDPKHCYAKLVPTAKGNVKLMEEGEGDLSSGEGVKRNQADFALWKGSKVGEPFWPSPWGEGRPGWHIECSVMAGAILGDKMDLHSGGIDLAFPHHDNELAQAEAHYGCPQWVNYFLHSGHLHIQNLKMSKSLKNFLTIKETLVHTPARVLRMFFLMHGWDGMLDYSEGSLGEAKSAIGGIRNFLGSVKALVGEAGLAGGEVQSHNFREEEADLLKILKEKQESIHLALCDSFDTPKVITELRSLISSSHAYLALKKTKEVGGGGGMVNVEVLGMVGAYVTKILRVFGVLEPGSNSIGSFGEGEGEGGGGFEERMMPLLKTMSTFRDQIRWLAQGGMREGKVDAREVLRLCDLVRDVGLVGHGVVLEDREGSEGALLKFVDVKELQAQQQEKLLKEQVKAQEREERIREEERKRREKVERGRVEPLMMYKEPYCGEFSEWDEKGLPTKDKEGVEVSKSRRKKLEKEQVGQGKLHLEYLSSLEGGGSGSGSGKEVKK